MSSQVRLLTYQTFVFVHDTLHSTGRFSPDDKFSRHRVTIKKRFGLLPMQQKNEKKQ